MDLWSVLLFLGVGLCAGASFFFALAETSLSAIGKWRIKQLAETGHPRGQLLQSLTERPEELLATIVFGNTLANGGIVALLLWPALNGRWTLSGSLIVAFVLVAIVCEVLPKTMAVRDSELWALGVAGPMRSIQAMTVGFRGLVRGFNGWLLRLIVAAALKPQNAALDAEYQELLELAHHQGTLAEREKEIILQIISLDRKTVRDVMRPRSTMAAIADDLPVEEMIEAARRHRQRRLPLYDESPDTIVGVLDTQALLLDPAMDIADAIEFPAFVPETMNLLQLFKSLQRQRRGLAIVLNEYGSTAGVVRVEDILQQVVGDIRSEGDAEGAGFVLEELGPGRWRVNGTMWLDDFRRAYPQLQKHPDVETMSGLVVALMEVVPTANQSVAYSGLRLTAKVVDERRVKELLVETLRPG